MLPLLKPGDEVLIDPGAYRRRPVSQGEIVIAQHPYRKDVRLVKRVASISANGRLTLKGDNLEDSTDSRVFGDVPPKLILGRVVSRF